MENVLYALEKITNNPLHEGFAFVRSESIRNKSRLSMDFMPDDILSKGRDWTVTRMKSIWTPQAVVGRVRAFNDYPCVNLSIPAFSRRAIGVLGDLLEPNGELLPLQTDIGDYFSYNITTVVDLLDHDISEIQWPDEKRVCAVDIRRYECRPETINGLSIFRLVEKPAAVYVTQAFVDRVIGHGLQGFHFIKLWPLPVGVSWRDEDRVQRKRAQQVTTTKGQTPTKANTVVLLFPIAKAKPSKAEKESLATLRDEIDRLLYNPSAQSNAALIGNLEGDDYHDGSIRVFLSCPDANALIDKLRPYLKGVISDRPIKVLKRYGEFTDTNCREEYVEV